jgi:mannose-6-phosphate isomerase-like protein (cupin superfamily)
MPVVHAPAEPTHDLGPSRFTSLATPRRGSAASSVWQVEIDPGTPATPHSMTSEEVFVVLAGSASVRFGDDAGELAGPGDAVVVPPGVRFEIAPAGAEQLRMVCCMPVGGQACTDDGAVFTPPWAE